MIISTGDLEDIILGCTDREFTDGYILNGLEEPWFFESEYSKCTYDEFKIAIASVFKTSKANIFICGSACFGRSLSPGKNFPEFKKNSDLDVIVVSEEHFEYYKKINLNAYYAGKTKVVGDQAKSVFKNFITVDEKTDLRGAILRPINVMYDAIHKQKSYLRIKKENKISLRIYKSRDDLIAYQNWSISQLKRKVMNKRFGKKKKGN